MAAIRRLVLALVATQSLGVLGSLPDPAKKLHKRSTYPACTPSSTNTCILGGKYLFPALDWSDSHSAADNVYRSSFVNHTFTLSQWTNNKIPEPCYYWGVERDHWNPSNFTVYNVTFSDCTISPFVICMNSFSPRDVSAIASEIGRIPAPLRQANSMFLVYGDKDEDNSAYGGYFASYSPQGILIGRSIAYFPSAIVHELGHAVDATLASPDAVHPNSGSDFSGTSTWRNAVTADGYAISAYGAESGWADNFADVGRAVFLDNIYPGGLAAFSGNNPNLTKVTNQINAFKSVAGSYYNLGGTCNPTLKFPYPTNLVDLLPTTTPAPTRTGTATPYGQCECSVEIICSGQESANGS